VRKPRGGHKLRFHRVQRDFRSKDRSRRATGRAFAPNAAREQYAIRSKKHLQSWSAAPCWRAWFRNRRRNTGRSRKVRGETCQFPAVLNSFLNVNRPGTLTGFSCLSLLLLRHNANEKMQWGSFGTAPCRI
jgi:hypothetical protein